MGRKREEKKKKKIQVWNSCLELLFGIFFLVWKVWNLCMDLLVRKLS